MTGAFYDEEAFAASIKMYIIDYLNHHVSMSFL